MSEFEDEKVDILTSEEEQKIKALKDANKDMLEDKLEPISVPETKAPATKLPGYNMFAAVGLGGALGSLANLLGANAFVSAPPPKDNGIARQLGLKQKIVVNNISGKKAWLVLSPAPISSVSSIGLTNVGQIDFTSKGGEIKFQQSPLLDNSCRKFDLDNNQIYYTVFFECDDPDKENCKKWKLHFKDRKINAKYHDINLLERHVLEAVDYDFAPIN